MTGDLDWCIYLACMMECTAPKPGNVHPTAAFDDLTYADFASSAPVAAFWLSRVNDLGVGAAVEHAARATFAWAGTNTNLGILLLIAPLAASRERNDLPRVLGELTVEDAAAVYRAIAIMRPGGMGEADDQDVNQSPTESLLQCMRLAADRDSIAGQYTNGFEDVYRFADTLRPRQFVTDWSAAVVDLHLRILSEIPDTLIARKNGMEFANEASKRSAAVFANGTVVARRVDAFDRWLRADGNRRNPGATADLVAAVLFVALREQIIPLPDDNLREEFE